MAFSFIYNVLGYSKIIFVFFGSIIVFYHTKIILNFKNFWSVHCACRHVEGTDTLQAAPLDG
jgi:hypothetical protein